MTYLPVPALADTLQRYLATVAPLLTDDEMTHTTTAVREFAEHDGRRAQAALEKSAEERNDTGDSWLTQMWLAAYLGGRTPLTLTSNVGFELTWPEDDEGLERAARLAHRLARVHLAHLRGEIDPVVSPRGELLCMRQWSYLAGGIRRPRPGRDEIVPGDQSPRDREILVLHHGGAHAVQISDAAGQVVPVSALLKALRQIVQASPPPAEVREHFAAWSYLASDRAAEYEQEAIADPHNAAVHDRLVNALFGLSLMDSPGNREEHLRDSAFEYGVVWPGKPVTYVISLIDDFVGMHIEHTVADGGTLQTVIGMAQDLNGADLRTDTDDQDDSPSARIDCLTWRFSDDVRRRLAADVAEYVEAAAPARVRVVRVPAITSTTMKLSADAMQQFVILYAQLRTYGRVRSTYESVDMREYQAGRTETMRPVSPQAVALGQALIDGNATPELLSAALAEHKRRIIACKKGEGIDRHLLGLRVMSAELGLTPSMFDDEGYRRLTTDFLSTTSLGTDAQIARYAFAPTSPGGIGIGYSRCTATPEFEFVLNHDAARSDDIDQLTAALTDGATALADLVAAAE